MIGVVVVFEQYAEADTPLAPDRELLGAPLLARAIAASIPAEQEARVVVGVDPERVEDVQTDIVRRFGLVEVSAVLPFEGSLVELLRTALDHLGEGVELILLSEGQRPLLPHSVIERVIGAALEHGAAVPTVADTRPLMHADGSVFNPEQTAVFHVQGPLAIQRERLAELLEGWVDRGDVISSALASGLLPKMVEGDEDNILVRDETDLSRAIEVWSRRAVDYAFLWPRPDRFDQLQQEQEAAHEEGGASASIDAMLAAGADDHDRSGPFDEAIANLHADDTDQDPVDETTAAEEQRESQGDAAAEPLADAGVNDSEFDDDVQTSPGVSNDAP